MCVEFGQKIPNRFGKKVRKKSGGDFFWLTLYIIGEVTDFVTTTTSQIMDMICIVLFNAVPMLLHSSKHNNKLGDL